MSWFWQGVLLLLALRLLVALLNAFAFPVLRPGRRPAPPAVSLLVPARDEAANLPHALPGLLRQGALEVVVLDDESRDGTPELVEALAARHPSLRLVRGEPLPPGWVGKNWACHQLARSARGEVLVFTDADVRWEEGALAALLERYRGGLLSAMPRQRAGGVLEAAVVPFVLDGLLSFFPHPLLRLPFAWAGASNGQVLALRREDYLALGGHASVRGSLLEDVALARRAKAQGMKVDLVLGGPLLSVRMYRGYLEAVEGFGKNFLPLHGSRAVLLASAFYHLAAYTLPWLLGQPLLGLAGVLERLLVQAKAGGPLAYALLTPLAPLLLLPVYARALWGPRRWKGRVYRGA
ncbi:4,4'-diaponeurosporenoate glycosyltransferase [Calidithermus terrae]|uniref:4,4'-diaponeurosporenoate glycosyltransferase n=1 Tax=Calidithermus terrae TaxID=1408545 RepID=A0A399EBA2_9DEIN|nr:glycosyltransferase [Calidithermus terrae]RIH80489.1 4,4'-diaponeurosporenoate glycosyltransferase [Calidithermus terrae]